MRQFLNTHHALYLESVEYSKIVCFTVIQVVLLLGIWAITVWTGLFGISFPLWIMALVPFRILGLLGFAKALFKAGAERLGLLRS